MEANVIIFEIITVTIDHLFGRLKYLINENNLENKSKKKKPDNSVLWCVGDETTICIILSSTNFYVPYMVIYYLYNNQ